MTKRLIIYLAGTGDYHQNNSPRNTEASDVLWLKGCEHPALCGSELFPNLSKLSKRIARAIKAHNAAPGSLATKLAHEGLQVDESPVRPVWEFRQTINGYNYYYPNACYENEQYAGTFNQLDASSPEPYDVIEIYGHSRGAVTSFIVAAELQELAVHSELYISAHHPVPGNSFAGPMVRQAMDLSACSNIKYLRLEMGMYVTDPHIPIRLAGTYHRIFYGQLVPRHHPITRLELVTSCDEVDHWHLSEDKFAETDSHTRLQKTYGISRRVQASQDIKLIASEPLLREHVNYRPKLVEFAQALATSTSFSYSLRIRSRRKEDFFTSLMYEISAKKWVNTDDAVTYLKALLQNAFLVRGRKEMTTSGVKAIEMLSSQKYELLRGLLQGGGEVDYAAVKTWSHAGLETEHKKAEHYRRVLRLST